MDDYPGAITYLDGLDCFILINGQYYASNDKMIHELPYLDISYLQFLKDNKYSYVLIDNDCIIVPKNIEVEYVTFPVYSYCEAGKIYLLEEEAHTEPVPTAECRETACKIRDEIVERVAEIRKVEFDKLVDEIAEECKVHLNNDDACFISKFYTEINYPETYNFSNLSFELYTSHSIIIRRLNYHSGWGIALIDFSKISDKSVFGMRLQEDIFIEKVAGSNNEHINRLISKINEDYKLDIKSINLYH